jgi:hypothetical protein
MLKTVLTEGRLVIRAYGIRVTLIVDIYPRVESNLVAFTRHIKFKARNEIESTLYRYIKFVMLDFAI